MTTTAANLHTDPRALRPVDPAELAGRLNWLRAGVLGANDGIVSVAATVVGVAAATSETLPVLLAGVAAVVAGAISMALGEYVSVASAADSQRSHQVAEGEVLNPWHAAIASGLSFLAGAGLPMLTILLAPTAARIPVTAAAVVVALAVTGGLGARLGGAPVRRAVIRVVAGGILALAATYAVGAALGVAIG
ncbi:MAG TPA: VIT1/CCC1 transporter family protein [Arachnia sp.]|nr:VIT1/CCC1 transporter family protein [Arachnia sp.]